MEKHLADDLQSAKLAIGDIVTSEDFRHFIESPPAEAARTGVRHWVVPVAILPDRLRDALQVQSRILRLKASVARKQKNASGDRGAALYAILQTLLDKGKRRRRQERYGRIVIDGKVQAKSYRAVLEREDGLPVLVSLHRR